jgi:hypothetical protein
MTFDKFAATLREHVSEMVENDNDLFVVDLDKDALWKTYLSSFLEGTNPVFRERTVHDCSACRQFIKSFGNVVLIKDGKVTTIWDFPAAEEFAPVVETLDTYVKTSDIVNVFFSDTKKIGTEENHEMSEDGTVLTWRHLFVEVPERFVVDRKNFGTIRGEARAQRDVFKRSLDEISEDAVLSILELVAQNSLYKGEEWKGVLDTFLKHQRVYSTLSHTEKELYAWEQSAKAGAVVGKIRNHSIGTLLVDVSNDIDLDSAVRKYEAMVAPSNYKRPKAIFTKKMLEEAEKIITELGYLPSLGRRHASINDITVNNILFANRDVVKTLGGENIFSEMSRKVGASPKNFDRVEEVPMTVFVSDILPHAQTIEVLLENKHARNLATLIAPENRDAPSMFKWNNPFSWAYTGNITDSMKERVKALGGDVSGVLRFSIQWNENGDTPDDLDAHCSEPNGNEIYYRNKRRVHPSSGTLDVDIIHPDTETSDGVAVENITWSDMRMMPNGTYRLFVHCYSHRGGRSGFAAEVEFNGQIYSFAYNQPLRQNETVQVAEVTVSEGQFSIKEMIPSNVSSREIWGLNTNQFHPVSVIMMSPNYWDGKEGVGNRHFFFMLKGCLNPESPNGFFNEYLKNDLLPHKRVFEALGGKMRVEPSDDQLSGIGFSSTQRNTLVIRVTGHIDRVIKVLV